MRRSTSAPSAPSSAAPERGTGSGTEARLVLLLSAILILAGCLISGPARGPARPATVDPSAVLDEDALARDLSLRPEQTMTQVEAEAAPRTIPELRERVAAVLEREQVPGVGLALVDAHGPIWSGGVGVASLESQTPVDADTVFRVASITKSVVALGVMKLHQENRLDLDAPLRETLPEIAIGNRWAEDAPITLAHALEHTAGFDDMRFNEFWAPREDLSPAEVLALNPRSREARWRPGSRMSYANPGYTVAAHAIERATGEPWEDYLAREVLRPLGMEEAGFRRSPERAARLATGYTTPGQAAPFLPLAHAPAGALLASPRELAGLVQLGLARGWPVVRADAFERIETAATPGYAGTDQDYGLGNYGDVMHPVVGRGHDGGLPGFLSAYRYFPELGVGYVMLLNATHSPRAYVEIRALLFAYLTRDKELPPAPIAPPDDDAIAAAAGYYGYASPRIELLGFVDRLVLGLHLRPAPGGVELELLTGGSVALVPTGAGGFRHTSQGGTAFRATRDLDGRAIFVIGMGQFEAGSATWAKTRLLAVQAALLLVQAALVWGLAWLLLAGVRRLRGRSPRPGALALHAWPALASSSFVAMLSLAQLVFLREAFADANPLSVALCLSTLVFPATTAAAVVATLRGARTSDGEGGLPLWARLVPGAASFACLGLCLWLLSNGIIGLRIWAW